MGLRELRGERTRAALHDAVLTLAEEIGYENVTIEMVAERAEVGVSTLYRYFPNKDAILLEPISKEVAGLAEALRSRPADEPRDVALGNALHAYMTDTAKEREPLARLRHQIDVASGPRARLWDLWHQQRVLLENAIAEREGVSATNIDVSIAGHITMTIVQLAMDRQRDAVDDTSIVEIIDEVIVMLNSSSNVIPAISTIDVRTERSAAK